VDLYNSTVFSKLHEALATVTKVAFVVDDFAQLQVISSVLCIFKVGQTMYEMHFKLKFSAFDRFIRM
jgi:hypothetical protein